MKSHARTGLGIGFIVGHEITHGFDGVSRNVGVDGKNDALWSQETNEKFDQRSKCFVQQYNNYTIPHIGLSVCHCSQKTCRKFLLFLYLGEWRADTRRKFC